jgi:cytochrome P450
MERTMLAFGAGKRVCLGRHIAELEMKKVIPRLLLEFDVRTPDTGLPHGIRR